VTERSTEHEVFHGGGGPEGDPPIVIEIPVDVPIIEPIPTIPHSSPTMPPVIEPLIILLSP